MKILSNKVVVITTLILFFTTFQLSTIQAQAKNLQQARQEAYELALKARAEKDPASQAAYEEFKEKRAKSGIKQVEIVDADNGMLEAASSETYDYVKEAESEMDTLMEEKENVEEELSFGDSIEQEEVNIENNRIDSEVFDAEDELKEHFGESEVQDEELVSSEIKEEMVDVEATIEERSTMNESVGIVQPAIEEALEDVDEIEIETPKAEVEIEDDSNVEKPIISKDIKEKVNSSPSKEKARKTAPAFKANLLDGGEITLEELKGKVVVLNVWWTGCPMCIGEMPHLNDLVEKYKNKDVVFLAMSVDNKDLTLDFLDNNDFNYLQTYDTRKITHKYNIFLYPGHVVIDKEGRVMYNQVGNTKSILEKVETTIEEGLME